jgi:hypothetical protein
MKYQVPGASALMVVERAAISASVLLCDNDVLLVP